MKRWILLLILFALGITLGPEEERDVSALRPVELILIYRENGRLCVATDTGDLGTGPDLYAALRDLEATAPGHIFLETADYLLVTGDAERYLNGMKDILRPATQIVKAAERVDTEAAAEFLAAHEPEMKLMDYGPGSNLPLLSMKEGRYNLE